MRATEALVIGGGQAGLATSRSLTDLGVDHLVLERGRVAESWRRRWDSLRLLTPNWMSRLPGYAYSGPDPDGFMGRDDVVRFLESYAGTFGAPVLEETEVRSARLVGDGWRVETDREVLSAPNLVVATGHCQRPRVPAAAASLDRRLHQLGADAYRNPAELPRGGVLVVGASATGLQLADEIHRSGREVVLAVGSHNRLPRRYRHRDIVAWLDRLGILDRTVSEMSDPDRARREPSLQLVGREGHEADLDLGVLASRGVRLVGRFESADGSRIRCAADLRQTTAEADARLSGLLDRIDRHVDAHGLADRFPESGRPARLELAEGPRELDLSDAGIATVLWATGFRRTYPWLHAPALDARGEIRQYRGESPLPGLFTVGLQFMIRRRSSFLDGVGTDAREIATRIAERLDRLRNAA